MVHSITAQAHEPRLSALRGLLDRAGTKRDAGGDDDSDATAASVAAAVPGVSAPAVKKLRRMKAGL